MPNVASPTGSTRRIRSDAWFTYWSAVDKGWGATCRLCLILVVRWGLPVSAAMKLAGLVLGHAR
jgi:hypothetical protein